LLLLTKKLLNIIMAIMELQQHRTGHEINALLSVIEGKKPGNNVPNDPLKHAAAVLSRYVLSSPEEIAILKFDLLSADLFKNLFKQMEDLTLLESEPMIYLEIDQQTADQYLQKDQTVFYRWLVGTFLSRLKDTSFSETEGYHKLATDFDEDFSRIYRPFDLNESMFSNHGRPSPTLDDLENIGANLKRIVTLLKRNDFDYPFPVINITTLPDLPRGSVEPIIPLGNLPRRTPNEQQIAIENRISFVSSFMQSVFLGAEPLRKLVAVPGWTIEVLRNEPNNQLWNRSSWSEQGILEELLQYRRVLPL